MIRKTIAVTAFIAFSCSYSVVQAQPTTAQSMQSGPEPVRRILDFSAKDATGTIVTLDQVNRAIAETYPLVSKYGRVQEGKRSYSDVSVSSSGTRYGGSWTSSISGVNAAVKRGKIQVAYLNGTRQSGSSDITSVTSTTITVSPEPGEPGRFSITASPAEEHLVNHLIIFPQKPLDSITNIQSDIEKVVKTIKPAISLSQNYTSEFEAPFPPAAVFANYERLLGRSQGAQISSGDTREGQFTLSSESKSSTQVFIKIFPYHDGSKVRVSFEQSYRMSSDGTTTFELDYANGITDQLKKIAIN